MSEHDYDYWFDLAMDDPDRAERRSYPDEDAADAAADAVNAGFIDGNSTRLLSWECDECGRWHIGDGPHEGR